VYLDWTPCHFGGQRPWFLCPAHGCGRRVALLYGGAIFACRHCHQLTYQSQRESHYQRAGRKVDKIIERLGRASDDNCWPEKPKNMRWRTYHRLISQAEYYDHVSSQGLMQLLAKLGEW
jgi:Zn-finger protein